MLFEKVKIILIFYRKKLICLNVDKYRQQKTD